MIFRQFSEQGYQYYRPVRNRLFLLAIMPVILACSVTGLWSYRASVFPALALLLILAGGLIVAFPIIYAVDNLSRRLEKKRMQIVLMDQQLLKMSRLAASAHFTRDYLGHLKDVFVNIDSAAAWGQRMVDQKNILGISESFYQIKTESVGAHQTIDRLLSYTRPPENHWLIEDIDVNKFLEDTLKLFAGNFTDRQIWVTKTLQKRLPAIRSNFSRLYQVFQSMFLAIASDTEQAEMQLSTAARGDGVRVEVSYPSRHFDRNVLHRLSDPAYALQSQDPGPWLALCLYHVERINGRLSAGDTDGGLKFVITLPYRIDNASSPPPRSFLKGL